MVVLLLGIPPLTAIRARTRRVFWVFLFTIGAYLITNTIWEGGVPYYNDSIIMGPKTLF